MAKYKVELTGVNTSELKVLTNEEQMKLFEELRAGNEAAKEELVNGNLKLVLSVLRKFQNTKSNMDDLFQVGVIGLIKAIDNFNTDLMVLHNSPKDGYKSVSIVNLFLIKREAYRRR